MRFLKYLLYFSFVVFFQSAYSAIPFKSVSSAEGDVVDVLVEGKEGLLLKKIASGIFREDGIFIEKLESENKSIELYVVNKKRKEVTVHILISGEQLVEHKKVKTYIMAESKVQDFFVNVKSVLTKGGTMATVEGRMTILDVTDAVKGNEGKFYTQVKDSSHFVEAYDSFSIPKGLKLIPRFIKLPLPERLKTYDFYTSVRQFVGSGITDGKVGFENRKLNVKDRDNIILEPGYEKYRMDIKFRNGTILVEQATLKSVDVLVVTPLEKLVKKIVSPFSRKTPTAVGKAKAGKR